MENVGGLIRGKMKLIFVEMLRELKTCGYQVQSRLLNAMYFDVPQNRERVIFLGIRNDLAIPISYPKAKNAPIMLREALIDVKNTTDDLIKSRYPDHTLLHKLLLQMREGEKGVQYHSNKLMWGLVRLRWNRPSRAVLREGSSTRCCQCCHPVEDRRLTIAEIKRVSSFPDEFILTGNVVNKWGLIGNSVPPLFMYAIANHIYQSILMPHEMTVTS